MNKETKSTELKAVTIKDLAKKAYALEAKFNSCPHDDVELCPSKIRTADSSEHPLKYDSKRCRKCGMRISGIDNFVPYSSNPESWHVSSQIRTEEAAKEIAAINLGTMKS